jgi:hypothetical protein
MLDIEGYCGLTGDPYEYKSTCSSCSLYGKGFTRCFPSECSAQIFASTMYKFKRLGIYKLILMYTSHSFDSDYEHILFESSIKFLRKDPDEILEECHELYKTGNFDSEGLLLYEKVFGMRRVMCGDSEKNLASLPSGSLNIIMTDPPYSDDVNYCELSEFWLSWTGNEIAKIFPNWSSGSSRNSSVEYNFLEKMFNIIGECHRVLSHDGLLCLFFASAKKKVWVELAKATIGNGFYMSAFYPISTEPIGALKPGKRYTISMVLVFRKGVALSSNSTEIYNSKIEEFNDVNLTSLDLDNILWSSEIMCGNTQF